MHTGIISNQQIIELENNKLKFDVIGLTETFRLIAPVEHFSLEGYHPFISKVRPPNDDNRGGVGLYISTEFSYKLRHDLSVFIPSRIRVAVLRNNIRQLPFSYNRCDLQTEYTTKS